MDEVFAESLPDNSSDTDPVKNISVLLLATKWQFDTYGLSTVHKSLVDNLKLVDSEGKKIKITCAVVEEEKNITGDQREEAAKYKVNLKGAKQPRGPRKQPNIEWLDNITAAYYLDLVRENPFDFIIGHVPYLANGPLNLRDLCPEAKPKPKVILMIHDFPRTTEGDIDDDTLLDWLSEADVVFSVGKEVEAEVFSAIASLPPEVKPIHKLYIPSYPLELFNIHRANVKGNKVQGTQNITMMTGNRKDLEIGGIDFPVAVASISGASRHILEFDGLKTNFVMMTDIKEDKAEWRKEFKELTKGQEALGRIELSSRFTRELRKANVSA